MSENLRGQEDQIGSKRANSDAEIGSAPKLIIPKKGRPGPAWLDDVSMIRLAQLECRMHHHNTQGGHSGGPNRGLCQYCAIVIE